MKVHYIKESIGPYIMEAREAIFTKYFTKKRWWTNYRETKEKVSKKDLNNSRIIRIKTECLV